MAAPIDSGAAVTREVLRSHFLAVVEAMGHTIERTSHSTFVKESADFVAALVTSDGEVFSYSRDVGVSSFLGLNLGPVIRQLEPEAGDVYITNDPYASEGLVTHLPDLHLISPVFNDGRVICWAWCFVHCSDVGGLAPTSISPLAYDVRQEGLRIPPQHLVRGGVPVDSLIELILTNSRSPHENLGDIRAMTGALGLAQQRIDRVVEKFGLATTVQGMASMLDWTEAVTRAEFSRIPDGEYSFVDYLDDDLAGSPVRLAATVRVAGDEVVVDYAGTDPQVSGALNLPGFGERHPFLAQGLINLVLTRNPSIPLTGGIMRAIRTTAPPGSVVNPHFPAAVGTRYATVIRLYNVVLGALAQALPDAIPSAGCGAAAVVSVSIPELHRGGTKVSVLEPLEGGGGAGEGFDGVSGNDSAAGYLRNTPVESIESAVAVRVLRYELSADSAGAGRFRGGWGTVFTFQLLRPDSVVTARGMERCRFQPWGLHGGEAAERTRTFLNPGSPAGRDIGRIDVLQPEPGDVVSVHSSGGGGYGNPLERDLDLIAADLDAELLSAEAAQQRYGVVFGADGIDARATAGRRAEMQHARPGVRIGDVDFGEARREYEAVWDAPASAALCALLYRLPVALRSYAKRRIHQVVESEPTTVAVADRLDGVWARIQTSLEERAVTIGLDTAGNEP